MTTTTARRMIRPPVGLQHIHDRALAVGSFYPTQYIADTIVLCAAAKLPHGKVVGPRIDHALAAVSVMAVGAVDFPAIAHT